MDNVLLAIWHMQCNIILLYKIYSCLSVCLSVTGGQRKRFDCETQEAVHLAIERLKLELGDLCEQQSWHYM